MTLEEMIQEIKSGRYDAIQNSCGGRSYDYSHAHFGNPPEEINYSHNDGAYFGNPATRPRKPAPEPKKDDSFWYKDKITDEDIWGQNMH